MVDSEAIKVAVIDYGLGNLFNVKRACRHVGMQVNITCSHRDIMAADAVILPGVGAFGDAMESLRKLDLIGPLKEVAATDKPLIGICLGMQLFMTGSCEFGTHRGLDLIKGTVIKFSASEDPQDGSKRLKVPQVGWNRIFSNKNNRPLREGENSGPPSWVNTFLDGISQREFMYFVHSFYVMPEDTGVVLSISRYGDIEFCSSLRYRNIFACQFHPERSDIQGLKVYENIASLIRIRQGERQ